MKSILYLIPFLFLGICSLEANKYASSKSTHEIMIAYESGLAENITQGLMQNGTGIHAVTGCIMNSLYQGASPAIISAALYKNIYGHAQIFKDALFLSNKRFLELYGKGDRFNSLEKVSAFKHNAQFAYKFYKEFTEQITKSSAKDYSQLEKALKNAITLQQISIPKNFQAFDTESMLETYLYLQAYIVMEECDSYCVKKGLIEPIYIMIPKAYAQAKTQNKSLTLSHVAHAVGLQSANFETPDLYDLNKIMPLENMEDKRASFIKGIKQLFTTDKKCKWSIVMIGHGMFKQESFESNCIASFDSIQFQELLNFFNDRITTHCFYYKSCYAGGMNFIEGFKDSKTGKQVTYNYLIASDATTEAPVMNFVGMIPINLHNTSNSAYAQLLKDSVDLSTKRIKLINTFDYKKFFELFSETKQNAQDWYAIFKCINPLCANFEWMVNPKTGRFDTKYFADVLSIRVPGSTEFKVLNHGDLCQLDHDGTAIKKNTQILFITQPTLSTVMTDSAYFPACISKVAGPSKHAIDHIKAENATISQIAQSFLPLEDLASSKFFTVDKATCINDFNGSRQKVTFTHIVFFNNIMYEGQKINGFIAQLGDKVYHYSYAHDRLISPDVATQVEVIPDGKMRRASYENDFNKKIKEYASKHPHKELIKPSMLSFDSFAQTMKLA